MSATATDNPLLDFRGLPRFEAIRPEHVAPAIQTLLERARRAIDAVAQDSRPPSFATVAEPVAEALDGLERAWSAVGHLNAVVTPLPSIF